MIKNIISKIFSTFVGKLIFGLVISCIAFIILMNGIKHVKRGAVNHAKESVVESVKELDSETSEGALETAGEHAADFMDEFNKKKDAFLKGYNKKKDTTQTN